MNSALGLNKTLSLVLYTVGEKIFPAKYQSLSFRGVAKQVELQMTLLFEPNKYYENNKELTRLSIFGADTSVAGERCVSWTSTRFTTHPRQSFSLSKCPLPNLSLPWSLEIRPSTFFYYLKNVDLRRLKL